VDPLKNEDYEKLFLEKTSPIPRCINNSIDKEIDKTQKDWVNHVVKSGSFDKDTYVEQLAKIIENYWYGSGLNSNANAVKQLYLDVINKYRKGFNEKMGKYKENVSKTTDKLKD